MDPRDRYSLTRQRLDERRASAQRARLVRGDWSGDTPDIPTLEPVRVVTVHEDERGAATGLARALSVVRLSRAATDA
jgi:hypothetical protein